MVKKTENTILFKGKWELHYKEILILLLVKGEKSMHLHRLLKNIQ